MRSTRLSILLAALALAACGSSTGPDERLAVARERWAARGPASYTLVVRRSCECLVEAIGPATVSVRARAVESRRYVAGGADVPAAYASLFPTVEGLFAIIDEARRSGAASVSVVYDERLGFPTQVSIDRDARMVDDEVTYTVVDLRAQ